MMSGFTGSWTIRCFLASLLVFMSASSGAWADPSKKPYRVHVVIVVDCSPGAWPARDESGDGSDNRLIRWHMLRNVTAMLRVLATNIPNKQLSVHILEPPSLAKDECLDGENILEKLKPHVLDKLFSIELRAIGAISVTRHPTLSTDGVLEVIRGLMVEENDVIWFYYSGHGAWITDREEHALTMVPNKTKNHFATEVLYRKTIRATMFEKNPRLSVLITDCCNAPATLKGLGTETEKDGDLVSPNPNMKIAGPAKMSRLFAMLLASHGMVDITSSVKGQYSYLSRQGFSMYTMNFVRYLEGVGNRGERVGWYGLQKDVSDLVEQTFHEESKNWRAKLGETIQPTQQPLCLQLPVGGVRFGARAKTTPDKSGVKVLEVIHGTPAADSGLQVGDTIVSINDADMPDEAAYDRAVNGAEQEMEFRVKRDGATKTLHARVISQ